MNALIPAAFSYQDHPLRVEQDTDGEPLFHAGDLCAILGYANPWDAVRRHVHEGDLVKREVTSDSDRPQARKTQLANYVREPGLWALILGSETEAAKPVKRWVTADVLPAIRKTGSYAMPGAHIDSVCVPVSKYIDLLENKVACLERALASGSAVGQRMKAAPTLRSAPRALLGDGFAEAVAAYVAGRQGVSIAEILQSLGMHADRAAQTRTGNVLRRLGWSAKQETLNGARVRVYRPRAT